MSFQEKITWVYAIGSLVIYGRYFVVISDRLEHNTVDEVPYVGALLVTIGISVVVQVIGAIVAALSAPSEAEVLDERDKRIHRHGEYIGGTVLSVSVVLPFGLALAGLAHFWIANAIFAAYALAALASSTTKLVSYRLGF